MNKITELLIGGVDYRVDYIDWVEESKERFLGELDHANAVIHISKGDYEKNVSDQRILESILHEVIHAIDVDYCIKLNESQVERLGNGLYSFLRNNPEYINKILKTLVKAELSYSYNNTINYSGAEEELEESVNEAMKGKYIGE